MAAKNVRMDRMRNTAFNLIFPVKLDQANGLVLLEKLGNESYSMQHCN